MEAVGSGELVPRDIRTMKKPTPRLVSEPGTIGSFFHIYGGQRELHNKEKLSTGPALVISSSGTDNGAYGFFDFDDVMQPPFASVPGTGSIGEAFVQEWPCGVIDHCYLLVPKDGVAPELLYVACATIRNERWRYSYGAQITPRRIAWLPMPSGEDVIEIVREHLASSKRIETLAFEEATDELDRDIARQRITEIASSSSALVSGEDLRKRLEQCERS